MKTQLFLIALLFTAAAFSLHLTNEEYVWKPTHPHTFAKKSSARVYDEVAHTLDVAQKSVFQRGSSSDSDSDGNTNGFAIALVILVVISITLCLIPIVGWFFNIVCCPCITIGVIVCIIGIVATR